MNTAHAEHTTSFESPDPLDEETAGDAAAEEQEWQERQLAAARAAHALVRRRRLRTLRAALIATSDQH